MREAEQIETLENRISELEQENKRLHETVDYLTKKLFGRSSEKTSVLALNQMSLFDEPEIMADPKAPEPDLKEVLKWRNRKFKGQRKELLKDIPHEKYLIHLPMKIFFVKPVKLLLYLWEKNSCVLRLSTYPLKSGS